MADTAPEIERPARKKKGSRRYRRTQSACAACLMPLLTALQWDGDAKRLAEAVPHDEDDLDLVGLRNTLANLNYLSRPLDVTLKELDTRLIPCLFIPERGGAQVILRVDGDTAHYFDGTSGQLKSDKKLSRAGTLYIFQRNAPGLPAVAQKAAAPQAWFTTLMGRFRKMLIQLMGVSALLSVLALMGTVFIIVVYDRVIATGSKSLLVHLVIGMAIVLSFELLFRKIRARMVAYIGARTDYLLGTEVFQQILRLPPAQIEHANVGSQVSRIKQLEAVRKFFTSPLALVFFELPFTVLFLAVIALLGGLVVLVPLVLAVVYVVMGLVLGPYVRRSVGEASRASMARQNFLIEMLANMRAIKYSSAEAAWKERYRGLSGEAAMKNYLAGRASSTMSTISHLIMMIAGVATLVLGLLQVIDGAMSVGALIGVMALVWRTLSPLQQIFLSVVRLEQVIAGIRHVNSLMRLPPERDPGAPVMPRKDSEGSITFQSVSLRYSADSEPALFGVSFDINPGEIVGIIGPNGAGKSTILKVILGIYYPQSGGVLVDGVDLRQRDPAQLRKEIAYLPQAIQLFAGSVAENLRLASPSASDEDLRRAASGAGVLDDILALPEGFDTPIGGHGGHTLSTGLQQRLLLARTYLKRSPIVLLDEPTGTLDAAGDRSFTAKLTDLRGKATVVFATHRLHHLELADRVLYFDKGVLCADGPAQEVLHRIKGVSNG